MLLGKELHSHRMGLSRDNIGKNTQSSYPLSIARTRVVFSEHPPCNLPISAIGLSTTATTHWLGTLRSQIDVISVGLGAKGISTIS